MMNTETTPAAAPAPVTPKVGDILISSWGWEQTNVNWYRVVAVTKASVKIIEIPGIETPTGAMTYRSMPDLSVVVPADVKPLTKRVKPWDAARYGVTLTSYSSASLWDGKAAYGSSYG